MNRPRYLAGSKRDRYGLLLIAIILVFLIQGIATPGRWEQVLVSILLGITLLLALRAAGSARRTTRMAAVLIALVMLASVAAAVGGSVDSAATRAANGLLVALAPPAIVVGLVRTLRVERTVTLETVFGVLCVYLLLGMLFSAVYGAIDRSGGGPFFEGGEAATVARCLYFSFTTLTTVGYGDLTARSNLGHTLAISEALIGQIYLVTIVALIVSNIGRGPRSDRRDSPDS